jgi:hypothetical protein
MLVPRKLDFPDLWKNLLHKVAMEAIKSSPVGRIYRQKTNAIVQRINAITALKQ